MPLFKLNENRYLNTDYVADIWYHPAGELSVRISFVGASKEEESSRTIQSPHNSTLEIQLLNKDLLPIRLEGDEADIVWAAFQEVRQQGELSNKAGGRDVIRA